MDKNGVIQIHGLCNITMIINGEILLINKNGKKKEDKK